MTAQRSYDRLAAANPIPDPVRYAEEELAHIRVGDVEALFAAEDATRVASPRSRRPVPAIAAFVIVLAAGVGALLFSGGTDRAPVGEDPVAVVMGFFDRWNAGDVDGALELVDPEATINVGFNSRVELQGLMEYTAGWGAPMEVACRPTELAGSVTCDWEWKAASVAALGLDGPSTRRFQVSGGLITSLATPSYGAHEDAISGYAKRVDPEGYAAACDPAGAVSVSAYGFAFDVECGRFLASLEREFIADLASS